jgi:hypothetical protein
LSAAGQQAADPRRGRFGSRASNAEQRTNTRGSCGSSDLCRDPVGLGVRSYGFRIAACERRNIRGFPQAPDRGKATQPTPVARRLRGSLHNPTSSGLLRWRRLVAPQAPACRSHECTRAFPRLHTPEHRDTSAPPTAGSCSTRGRTDGCSSCAATAKPLLSGSGYSCPHRARDGSEALLRSDS